MYLMDYSTERATMESIPVNHGPVVVAVTYTIALVTLLFMVLRTSLHLYRKRKLGQDDVLLILATIFSLIGAVMTERSVAHGLGRSIDTLRAYNVNKYFKYSYCATLLSMVTMSCAKQSMVVFLRRITPEASPLRRAYPFVHGIIGLWMVFSIFALAFECHVPMPWIYLPTRCAGQGAVWYPVAIFNILTDFMLLFLRAAIIRENNVPAPAMFKLLGLSGTRLLVIIVSICHLVFITPALKTEDQTSSMTVPAILLQLVMNLSIITAALPSMSRQFTNLETESNSQVISHGPPRSLVEIGRTPSADQSVSPRHWTFDKLADEKDQSTSSPRRLEIVSGKVRSVIVTTAERSPRLTLNFKDVPFLNNFQGASTSDMEKQASTQTHVRSRSTSSRSSDDVSQDVEKNEKI